LYLASGSPQRRKLLSDAGYDFIIRPAGVDEDAYPKNLLPSDIALHLARAKADAVSEQFPDAVVLGADTVVAFGDRVLGKPRDAKDAYGMLDLLAGTTHIVITGVAVICRATSFVRAAKVMSAVRMKTLTPKEIQAYVESNEWQGKAGGYGIQDNDPFVERVAGDHENIIGLPMKKTIELLEAAGVAPVRRGEDGG
jgi:septum formation protein